MIKITALVGVALVSANVSAASIFIDEFTIVKNDNIIFQDTFSNGIAPLDNGGNRQSYGIRGGPLGLESEGKLALDARQGEDTVRPDAGNMRRQGVGVNTNVNPDTPDRGLRIDDTFSVTGLFDLTNLTSVRERYGVRFNDSGSLNERSTTGLSVMRTSESQLEIVLHEFDKTNFSFIDIESMAVDMGHEQIALRLSRMDVTTNEITAAFAYVDGGIMGDFTVFTETNTIFNGEDFARAGFIYLAPVPIPAALWLFGSGLLGLLAVAKRRGQADF